VVERAAANGVTAMALTDHDSTEGLGEATAAAVRIGIRLIPGVELSTDLRSRDVHLLAYGFDVGSSELQEWLRSQRETRIGRAHRIVEILRDNGMPITVERVFEIAGEATVGRPHVARALLEKGYVQSVQEAFDRWLGDGKPGDVPRPKLSPADAIAQVHRRGGVVFCAHPGFLGDDCESVVRELTGWGLDGIEAFYKHYDSAVVTGIAALAADLGLETSGGSDYHGLGNPDDREIGDIPFPDAAVDRFLSFIDQRTITPWLGGPAHARS
jgi:predicted metal-dependent phosphoesterase TrpH